jgi:hypothetical protein
MTCPQCSAMYQGECPLGFGSDRCAYDGEGRLRPIEEEPSAYLGPHGDEEPPREERRPEDFQASSPEVAKAMCDFVNREEARERDSIQAEGSAATYAKRERLPRAAFIRQALQAEVAAMLAELEHPPLVERLFPEGWRKADDQGLAQLYDLCLRTIATRAATGFQEDHSLGKRSWGKGRHSSIPKTSGAEGRNYVD